MVDTFFIGPLGSLPNTGILMLAYAPKSQILNNNYDELQNDEVVAEIVS